MRIEGTEIPFLPALFRLRNIYIIIHDISHQSPIIFSILLSRDKEIQNKPLKVY